MRLVLDLSRGADGRWEGTVHTEAGGTCPFCGTLDLLRVLDELGPGPAEPVDDAEQR